MSTANRFFPYAFRNMRPKPDRTVRNGFTATLLRGDLPVANIDAGNPEDPDRIDVEFISQAEQDAFIRFSAARMTEQDRAFSNFTDDTAPSAEMLDADEAFIRLLAEDTYHSVRLSKICETSTLFALPGDQKNQWRQIDAPYRAALATAIRRQHPDAEILNERLAVAAIASG